VIVGGESGRGARPMSLDWARSIRDACQDNGVAFHYKQQGSGDGGPKSRRDLDGRTWDEFPVAA
jgi:protein gp37